MAYDVILANLDPSLERVPPPESAEPLLRHFRQGLTTAEVGLLLADGPDPVCDLARTKRTLLDLEEVGAVQSLPLGSGELWRLRNPA